MIISESYAKKLIREGRGDRHGWTTIGDEYYAVIIRSDVPYIDHYKLRPNSREYAVMKGATT